MSHVQPENKILDHLYSTYRDAYKALPRPPFGKSDHNSIHLIPVYKQKLKQESDEVDAKLQNCFASTDWNMFRDSYDNIEEFTTSVTGIINKCINDDISTVTVRTCPNQKPWITGNNRTELKASAAVSRSGTLIWMLIRNPAMTSDVAGLANYHELQKETQSRAVQWCEPT